MTSRYQQLASQLAKEICSKMDGKFEAPIQRAGAIGRAKLATAMAPFYYIADAHRVLTYKVAAAELEKIIDLYDMGHCNASQRRIAEAVLDDTSCVKSILASAFDNPSVEKFWRHHTKHHGDKPLSEITDGMLHRLVAEHYTNIPGIEDLQGKAGFAR